ncbi:hypothetical protein [Limimaricola sp.]
MFAQALVHVPAAITGLPGAGLIGVAPWPSVRHNRAGKREQAVATLR